MYVNKIGKIGRINIKANRMLGKLWEKEGIDFCEVRILHDCTQYLGLTNAHRHKRVWYRGKPELLWSFNQVIRACVTAHNILEPNQLLTEEVFTNLRGEEDGQN